ncbi:MAG: ornithine carbamoyltransferase [Spirochaetia bacterium]
MEGLRGRSLLQLLDYSRNEIQYLLQLSLKVKKQRRKGEVNQRFTGKTLAMIFEKRSTRTRCAFETAFGEEGGHPVFLSLDDIQLGTKETVEDTARVLGRMFDAIEFRGFSQETVRKLAEHSGVPVYNGLTDLFHPTQVLADLMTVLEIFGEFEGRTLTFIGDGRNNMANSLLVGCAIMGMNIRICAPKNLHPEQEIQTKAQSLAVESGAEILITDKVDEAVPGSDVLYTDVWASMGEEDKMAERISLLKPYQVNKELFSKTGKAGSVFMHCLPAVKGNEVTEDVFEGQRSVVWEEAENRKHTIKAVMLATLGV